MPRPKPGDVEVRIGAVPTVVVASAGLNVASAGLNNVCIGTGVGLARLAIGIVENPPLRKSNARIATGISETTVSRNGVEKAGGATGNSSLMNWEN